MCAIPNNSDSNDRPDPETDANHSSDEASQTEENGAEANGSDDCDEPTVEQQLVAAIAARDESHDRWLRCRAEIENVQKRGYREMLELRQFQVLPLVRDLLPVLDNLHRALAAAESSQSVEDLIQGMQMVLQQFQGIIAGHSVTPIEAVGEPFDPNVHEAIQQRPATEQPANTVLEEIEQGFRMHDRVIRPSKVIVSCQPIESPDADGTTTQDDAGA